MNASRFGMTHFFLIASLESGQPYPTVESLNT